jgi:hypothetical protein
LGTLKSKGNAFFQVSLADFVLQVPKGALKAVTRRLRPLKSLRFCDFKAGENLQKFYRLDLTGLFKVKPRRGMGKEKVWSVKRSLLILKRARVCISVKLTCTQ